MKKLLLYLLLLPALVFGQGGLDKKKIFFALQAQSAGDKVVITKW